MEEALYEIASIRRFAGLSLAEGAVPDETTILNFWHVLEINGLVTQIFETANTYFMARRLRLSEGTIVDATIIAAPGSTRNASGTRDPGMHQTKKGNKGRFGMKARIGVDAETGLVNNLSGTATNVHDITQTEYLLHGSETDVFADAGYREIEKRSSTDMNWYIAMWPGKRKQLTQLKSNRISETIERLRAGVRAEVEHPFCGLAKNTAQLHTLFALSNLWIARRYLLFTE